MVHELNCAVLLNYKNMLLLVMFYPDTMVEPDSLFDNMRLHMNWVA